MIQTVLQTENDHYDVALLTDRRYTASKADGGDWYFGNILREDELLGSALDELGITSVRVDWSHPGVDWSKFRCAVFRTTWDYFERFPEFSAWLDRVGSQTRLCNEASIIRWNLDKHYLADLEDRGIPVVRSRFLEPGSETNLNDLLSETGWEEAVLKPCVSGAARHTYRIHHKNVRSVQSQVQSFLTSEAFLIQPFISEVVHSGEDSLMVIDGQYTHAVRKVPKKGDFRVQDDHGGTVHPFRPSDEQIELAERTMDACRPVPAYGRVDMVRDNDGQWSVMELELIEPELWLRHHPPAAKNLARAIARIVA